MGASTAHTRKPSVIARPGATPAQTSGPKKPLQGARTATPHPAHGTAAAHAAASVRGRDQKTLSSLGGCKDLDARVRGKVLAVACHEHCAGHKSDLNERPIGGVR
jgi:hypothetical protein